MEESGRLDWVERLIRQRIGCGYTVKGDPVWLIARPDRVILPEHGWKLHVSSRASNFPSLVETLLPLLLAEGCVFKLARSQQVLHELNDGLTAPASVGKAFTIYPDQRRVRELGLRLARTLRGHHGPRVLSDRQVAADAPVYYRYGSFAARRSPDLCGRPVTRLRGPGAEEFDGLAGLSYRQPSWAVDPFTGEAGQPEHDPGGGDILLGGRYRVVIGIREAAQGNVYRAIDTQHNRPVVVKQARALVAEHGDGNDSRMRLRNERRVLRVLDGAPGVPRFIDHFRHGDDEFLVNSDCGPRTLADDVQQHGPYQPGPGASTRTLDRVAADLVRILSGVHERGVIVRDLSPANILVGDGVKIIDFGLAAHDGFHLAGKTPGYAPARQSRDEPPRDTDDLHALGMALLFAATGLHPVTLDEDPDLPRTRALQTLTRDHGQAPSGVMAAIAELLSGDEDRVRASARRIAAGAESIVTKSTRQQRSEGSRGRSTFGPIGAGRRPPAVTSRPAPPVVTQEVAAEVTDNLVRDLLGMVSNVLEAPEHSQAAHDVSIYSGSAGIGLELLHHRGRRRVTDRVRELTAFTVRAAGRVGPTPGLFTGMTGTDMFLQEATNRDVAIANWPGRSLPPPGWEQESADLVDGYAGIGLGHLYFYRAGGDPADLDVARRCVQAVSAERPLGPSSAPGLADPTAGRAHGLAGTAELLLRFAEDTGEATVLETAAEQVRHLAERARSLIDEAKHPAAEQMTVSWCRGLSGIGQTLRHASTVLNDTSLADLARQAADACIVRAPGLSALGQCCGAAGVGNYLVDMAAVERAEQYWVAAHDVAAHLLLRSAGPPTHPRFYAPSAPPDRSLSWAHGLAGILSLFRRLACGGGDCLPAFR